ncbi:flagellar biosynthesis regulator FlaF [Falsiroseomonas selenitidurans]|uniref:Uncharacterized protein n=1 Tax=Falsiroseomonas selenitidurans TaxID=2716335 RepID=A0ABX1E9Y7_9PROT|nr:flagellar biosynthesis regulator FlaF [Falsiroseomonas selenitidurans]NKC34006.1 hypothetical protein [Falsiroseomonas selenitidurans]
MLSEAPALPIPAAAAAHRAYGAVRAARSQREQEADVFRILAGRLRAALRDADGMAAVRAAADARRVFTAVETLVLHPSSPLPRELRLAIGSVARRALREVDEPEPDLSFLAALADDFAAGLQQRPGQAP